ncbi:uncharacterized protein LOC130803270 isoform X2 [Amaranthus tricolor]|uniref:uncharacterized protein LOC130803270 isoform X2 n=1 Tax=Amaranthus tricolor TaxID=29722 RepID=UPI00258317F9|nr:uncharacterized protein LOC130803270 isoform X2 [Amaranthus tricolor]XP_057523476.1 uncharacterized protein LOC130803270 isoform X2 [Amaranthus tricolor]
MGQAEANFFFIMCQMIAEAACFTFMEKLIISGGTKPESKEFIAFYTNWNKAAKAIHATVPTCKDLKEALQIGKGTYKTVADLRVKIALIKFEKKLSDANNFLEFRISYVIWIPHTLSMASLHYLLLISHNGPCIA